MDSLKICIPDQRFKLGSTRDGHVESLGGEEGLEIKEIEVVVIHQIGQQLVGQTVEGRHHRQGHVPILVAGAVDHPVWYSKKRRDLEFKCV